MSTRQRGLGRGLGALIAPAGPVEARPVPRTSPSDFFFNGTGTTGSGTAARPSAAGSGSSQTLPPQGQGPSGQSGPVPGERAPDAQVPDAQVQDGQADGQVVGELALLGVDAIVPNPRQPRTVFDEDALDELTASVREVGVLQPVVVRPVPDVAGRYELVMGERRWRASQAAGLTEIPAVVRTTTDDDLLRDALLENLHRSELNPLEEAAAYAQLLSDFGCTHEQLSSRLGTSRSHLTNTMRLLNLSPAVQRRVAAGVLTAGHARALLGLEDAAAQDALAARIVAEGLSVRTVEELVAVATPTRRRRPAPAPQAARADLAEVESALTDRFDTRVRVQMGRSKGRITVEFAGMEDLQRILAAMQGAPPSV